MTYAYTDADEASSSKASAAAISALEARIEQLERAVQRLSPKSSPHIPRFCTVGAGANIDPTCVFMADKSENAISIGQNTKVLRGAEWIGPITVGTGCYFNKDSYVRAFVTIGNDVLVGPFVRFVTDSHEIGNSKKRGGPVKRAPILVGNGAWIGASVSILGGVNIGEGAIIAAGAVVTSDVPPNTVAGGVPARVLRILAEE